MDQNSTMKPAIGMKHFKFLLNSTHDGVIHLAFNNVDLDHLDFALELQWELAPVILQIIIATAE